MAWPTNSEWHRGWGWFVPRRACSRHDSTVLSIDRCGLIGSGWHTEHASIGRGDTLCVYTDGLVEVRNHAAEFFGPERLAELVQGSRCDQAPQVVQRCLDEVERFSPGGLRDDATIVVVCRPDA